MKLSMIMVLMLWGISVQAQSNEKEIGKKSEQVNVVQEKAEGSSGSGKEKGLSVSSAARRSTLMRERANSGNAPGNSEYGKERAASRADNANRGNGQGNNGKPDGVGKPELPPQARPSINVPQSRPNAPVVRPNRPAPQRPNTPSGRPNTPPNRPNPPGKPGG
jgi:hypothetical protein